MADTPVSADTDDLNAFNDLLNGKAPEATPAAEPEDGKTVAEPVDDADAPDDDASTPDVDADTADDTDPDEGADNADDDAGAEDEGGEDDENILRPKKKQTAKERINELVRQAHEAERRAADAERRAAEAEAARAAPKQDEQKRPVATIDMTDAPHPDAVDADGALIYPLGEYDPQFLADRTEFLVTKQLEQREAAREAKAAEDAANEADRIRATAWETKLAEAEAELDDIRPTIQTLDTQFRNIDPTYGTYLAQTIMDMDMGPQVLYYLANNPDEAQRIVDSGPQRATLALGRLEARIQTALAKKSTPAVRQTNAPKPPASTPRGNAGAGSVRPDTDDLEAFERQLFKKK